jgi:HSP20 family protein
MGLVMYMAKEVMKEINNKSKEFYEFVLPPVDMLDNGKDLLIIIDLPGFDKKDIDLRITKNILSIKANRKDDGDDSTSTVYFKHRPTKINKKIILPFSVEDEEITGTANYLDGIVTLRIPLKKSGSEIPIT